MKRILLSILAVFLVLALIALPLVLKSRKQRANDEAARMAGRYAKTAAEVHYCSSGGDNGGAYASTIEELLVWEKHLTDDTDLTFTFGKVTDSGYTFTVIHAKGTGKEFVFTD